VRTVAIVLTVAVVAVALLGGCGGSGDQPVVNSKGLTYGVLKHPNGTLAPNTTINFWCGGVKTSDVTDTSGNYALFLTGPAQYAAQVGGQPCAESPVPVLAGTLLCNLTTPTN